MKYQPSAVSVVCDRLQRPAGSEVPEPDPGEGVPQAREPTRDVDAEQLERADDHADSDEPCREP